MNDSYRNRNMTFRWRPIITMVLCSAAGAAVGLFFAQRTPYWFRVEAELMVMMGRETSKMRSEMVALGGPQGAQKQPDPNFVTGEVMLLRSPWVLRETVESMARDVPGFHEMTLGASGGGLLTDLLSMGDSVSRALGLKYDIPLAERSLLEWAERLELHVSIRTDVITVACLVTDAALGEAFLTRLLEKYEEAHVDAHSQAAIEAILRHELETWRTREREAEAALRNFNTETGILDYPSAFAHLVGRRLVAETRARQLAVDQAVTAAEAEQIQAALQGVPETSVGAATTRNDPTHDYMAGQLVRSQEAEAEVTTKWLDERVTLNAHERTEIVRELLDTLPVLRESASVVTERDPMHALLSSRRLRAEFEAASSVAERAAVEETLRELRAQLVELEQQRGEFVRLSDELGEIRRELTLASKGDQMARLSGLLEEAGFVNVRVINPPKAEVRPERMLGRDARVGVTMAWAVAGLILSAAYYALRSAIIDEIRSSRGEPMGQEGTSS